MIKPIRKKVVNPVFIVYFFVSYDFRQNSSLILAKRKTYHREFKREAVALITEKGYSIAEASRNLGIEYSVLRRWKTQLTDDPQNAFPGKGKRHPADEEFRKLQKELERVKEERDIQKSAGLLCGESERKFQFIADHRETFKVGRMCRILQVSPSGFYSWRARPESRRSIENRALADKIRILHAASHGIYGSPKIHQDLTEQGVRCGKNRVARIIREAGIRYRTKNKFKATTDSRHNLPVAHSLLNQAFTADAPDRTWVGDITYVHTQEGWLYLAVLIDLFNRKVVGWSASSRLTRQLAIDAPQMAVDQRRPAPGLLHHSDRGSQYASGDYQKRIAKHKMTCSMSRKGNCYDNAVVESFFRLQKTEWVHHHRHLSRSEATSSLFYYIEIFYNRKRRHSVLDYATPQEYEAFTLAA